MRRYIIKTYKKLYFKKKIEYSQVKFLMNTQGGASAHTVLVFWVAECTFQKIKTNSIAELSYSENTNFNTMLEQTLYNILLHQVFQNLFLPFFLVQNVCRVCYIYIYHNLFLFVYRILLSI